MDLCLLDKEKDIFRKTEEQEPLWGSDKPYLSAIWASMFLAKQTRQEIAFVVKLLAKHSSQPTIRHWNGVKRIFRYLCSTIDMSLYYPAKAELITRGCADAGYLLDPADAKSQMGYIFLTRPTTFSWKSSK
jgi:hypothetical protein